MHCTITTLSCHAHPASKLITVNNNALEPRLSGFLPGGVFLWFFCTEIPLLHPWALVPKCHSWPLGTQGEVREFPSTIDCGFFFGIFCRGVAHVRWVARNCRRERMLPLRLVSLVRPTASRGLAIGGLGQPDQVERQLRL